MDGRPVILKEAIVTGNFFQLLGVSPVLGRLLRPADDTLGGLQSIVLSYGTWRRQFAGDTAILGRHFRSPYETPPYKSGFTIIGVAPPGLDFPVGADFWADAGYPDNWQMDAVGRLATAAAPGAARSEFLGLMQQLGRRQTVSVDVETADIHTLLEAITGEAKPVLIVVSAAVVFLLIISCVNVGNLLLVRGAIRSPELVLRRAIGGTSRDLARLLSFESTLLVVAGGMLGLVLAQVLEALLFASHRVSYHAPTSSASPARQSLPSRALSRLARRSSRSCAGSWSTDGPGRLDCRSTGAQARARGNAGVWVMSWSEPKRRSR